MSYVINNSRGNIVAVVPDGTINTTATSINLVGRGVTPYGLPENENYVYLLENFANSEPPTGNILVGQLWYNSSTDVISAYGSANSWISLASQTYVQDQKASPTFTGVPNAPTADYGTNTTQLATTAFVQGEKLSPAFTGTPTAPTATSATSTTQLATTAFVQAQKISPVFTGIPAGPTAVAGTNTSQLATTEFVTNAVTTLEASTTATTDSLQALKAPLASPVFSGTPTAPTPSDGDVSLKIATTAFVRSASPVLSVAGKTGSVTLLVTDITGAAPTAAPTFTGDVKAPTPTYGDNSVFVATTAFVQGEKISPAFTGTPTAPTAGAGTNNTQIATTAYTDGAVSNYRDIVTATYAPLISPTLSGTPRSTTFAYGTNGTQIATTAFVQGEKVSPAFTGTPTAPTATPGTNTTQIATTAFVYGVTGTLASQNANAIAITGGTISGLSSPLDVPSGGTGGNTAASARAGIGAVSTALTITAGAGLTGGGDLTNNRSFAIASNSNGYGNRTISASAPTGGSDGDIWYQI